jgi:hypothetical protein
MTHGSLESWRVHIRWYGNNYFNVVGGTALLELTLCLRE